MSSQEEKEKARERRNQRARRDRSRQREHEEAMVLNCEEADHEEEFFFDAGFMRRFGVE